MTNTLNNIVLPDDIRAIVENKKLFFAETRNELLELALGDKKNIVFDVKYEVKGKGLVHEATVVKCKNGLAVNYIDPYMRRRDPDCMLIADDLPTDKPKYKDRYKKDFAPLRSETFDWLKNHEELIVLPFWSGGEELEFASLMIAPLNAGFFAGALADLQGFIPASKLPKNFTPTAIIFLAPPFRHTNFDGQQVVVHNRTATIHEMFAYNLYPGPSAKKGVYGFLLEKGEQEHWATLHSSCVKLVTPYDNEFVFMHEGASGGGKSELLEEIHREPDGRILLAQNSIDKEKIIIELADTCELFPVTDDMAINIPKLQGDNKKLVIKDAENSWFLRVDHITEYGGEPQLEKLTIHPQEPLIFLNIEAKPESTCLIWEHIMDSPTKRCPNPRVILPRHFMPNVLDEAVSVDVRSFGVRTPPTTRENPNYGIIGFLHVLPPALAWLWRLVAPRGHGNPSIISADGLISEGVGSYWPFATGKLVAQANILLEQILNTPNTQYTLLPNQYVGVYKVRFMPEWITREYFARRGTVKFKPEQLDEARSPLLGYIPNSIRISGEYIPHYLLQVEHQPEIGFDGYDAGVKILTDFFKSELKQFLTPELSDMGRKIIECCLNDGSVTDYANLLK